MLSYFNGRFYASWANNSAASYQPELGFNVASFPFSSVPHTGVQPSPTFTTGTTLFGVRGTTASISSNGLSNGILWNLQVLGPGATDALLAYDTSGNMLFNSNWKLPGAPDNTTDSLTAGASGATGVKFSVPTVYNGMVYADTGGASGATNLGTVVGYGLLNPALTTPGGLVAQANSSRSIHLSWSRGASDQETGARIERSLDGVSGWAIIGQLATGSTSFDDTNLAAGTHYFYRVTEQYGLTSSASAAANTITAIPGDADCNLRVDTNDLYLLALNYQQSPRAWGQGDFNYDGKVDGADLAILAGNWQQTLAPPAAPLPSSTSSPTRRTATRVVTLIE
jgi:hypothetical protein